METAIVVALISAGIALLTAIVSATVTITQKYRSNVIAIVTNGRIKYLDDLRDGNTAFAALTNHDVIKAYSGCYPLEVRRALSKMSTFLKPFYDIERALVGTAEELATVCIKQFDEPQNDFKDEILRLKARYTKLYAQYDWAYWRYIQAQVDGKKRNSDTDFDRIYAETKEELCALYDYTWEL